MSKHCDLHAARCTGGFVIRVRGSGTSRQSPALAGFVRTIFEQHPEATISVDLLRCEYLDSTFLGCLLTLQRTGQDRFEVVANDASRERLLTATRIDSCLRLTTTAPPAGSAFEPLQIDASSDRELGQHMMETHQALAEVPSEFAARFKSIALQLMRELEQQPDSGSELAETVILPAKQKG